MRLIDKRGWGETRREALGEARGRVLDLRARTPWKRCPAAESPGPLLVSYTEFTPHAMRDLPAIYFAAERLRRECTELEGAVGVTTYWQPFRRRVGSLSVWESEEALRRFVSLPFHVEIMRRYRSRGSLRAVSWQADAFALRAAFRKGQKALGEGRGWQR
jgi:heme-degrading monooxygenase HmoA